MRLFSCVAVFAVIVAAFQDRELRKNEKLFTIELAPSETRSVTEAEKFDLINEGISFIDVTDWPEPPSTSVSRAEIAYPKEVTQEESVRKLIGRLDQKGNTRENLEKFSSFNNRYYQSETRNQSAEWLMAQVFSYVPQFTWVFVTEWTTHGFRQSSITAQIPGKSNKTIVIGAHQDSINVARGADPMIVRAPGADDNGSGSMTILEAFRTVRLNNTVADNEAEHTIEFHWYTAEEVGLLGSGDIFRSYAKEGVDVVAMLNQDMTGYTAGYTSHNMTPKFGIVTDRTDPALTNFTRLIIDAYTGTEAADTQCGYGCSDHDSATRAGYPSAFVFEGEMGAVNDNPYIHSAEDTIEKIDFGHVVEHAKLVIGFVMELAFAKL